MRTPQFVLPRGGSPTLELELPFTPGPEDVISLTVSQAGVPVLEYTQNCSSDFGAQGSLSAEEDGLLLVHMTQADTLRLETGECDLQLRIRTEDGADVFPLIRGAVSTLRRQGVL